MESYYKDTKPLVEYYKKQNLHRCVDAEKSDDEVWKELDAILANN